MTALTSEQTSRSVTYVIGTYPLLTTTFIDREIETLREWGVDVGVFSLRRPHGQLSETQQALAATTTYVRPVGVLTLAGSHLSQLARRPARYFSTMARLVLGGGQSIRERVRTVGHFGLGVHVAHLVEEKGVADRVHAHFIDRAAVVAHVVGRLLGLPYSVTAHAVDIYVDPVLLETKIKDADFVATCTGYNESHLVREVPQAAPKITRVYHGIDVASYEPGAAPDEVPLLLSVGQLKVKKGFLHLIDACRILADRDASFACEIIGEGPQRSELEDRIRELELDEIITLRGAVAHDEVVAAYRRARAFVLACIQADDGDRDGIPNVILEAMAMQLPVVSTHHSGIPEAVDDGVTGLLVPTGDAEALADALSQVLDDPARARGMGVNGREVVSDRFDLETNVRLLHDRFVPVGAFS